MVGNTILDVDVLEVLQPLTGKVGTSKTPSHSMLLGALAKTMAAFFAGGHHVVRMAAVTAYFFKSKACSLSPPFQLPNIIYLMGEIAGAIAAINAAYPNQFPVIFFHTTTYHGRYGEWSSVGSKTSSRLLFSSSVNLVLCNPAFSDSLNFLPNSEY